jgi:hypothetical protein
MRTHLTFVGFVLRQPASHAFATAINSADGVGIDSAGSASLNHTSIDGTDTNGDTR